MKPVGDGQLAIVIPAYKTKFLRATLQSIAAQTDQRFRLYVGDDASPEPVEMMVREFSQQISTHYQRFNENLGKKSLIGHWTRCLHLTTEPWLWIFSDDDLMEPGCVAAFYAELAKTSGQHEAYRFNTIVEKSASRFPEGGTEAKPPHPKLERGKDFLCSQLRGPNNSNMQEIIFSRAAWQRVGIPDFPLAWGTDDVFIASLGEPFPLYAIDSPRIHWRWSDYNITGGNSRADARRKQLAEVRQARWAFHFLTAHGLTVREAAQLTEEVFYRRMREREVFLGRPLVQEIRALAAECWGRTAVSVEARVLAVNSRLLHGKIARRIRRRRA
jgi:glycosyltransferase involved in cell wall biosynthesis